MRVILATPIDGSNEISLVGQIPAGDPDSWQSDIASTLEVFDSFLAAGGLIPAFPSGLRPGPGSLTWNNGEFTCSWPRLPVGASGLAVILRMLGHIQHGDEGLASVSILGTSVPRDHPAVIHNIQDVLSALPARIESAPFQMDICPSGPWINIECDVEPDCPPEVPAGLHESIWSWGNVVHAGGFQVDSILEGATADGEFGIGIDGPIVADDFLEWHCLMTGVPPGSLACLVNVLAAFSRQTFPISTVYMG